MWEEVASQYNAKRERTYFVRDYDSLRRQFRSLYGKAKPSGFNGEAPPHLRPIARRPNTS
ncbi:hypothetical protein PC128_g16637 [Phytophthora cactorum]|nr:hypothetical protein PC128_g16637 [Phytophthora cactorum]